MKSILHSWTTARSWTFLAGIVLALTASPFGPQARGQAPDNGPARGAGPGSLQGPAPTYRDLDYAAPEPAESRGHKLDIYIPDGTTSPRPAVFWSRGSAFGGDTGKESIGQVAKRFMDAGYIVVGVSVRSSGQVKFPGLVYDIKAAARWIRANAAKYHIDPDRIGIIGTSSGGWVGAMAALTGGVKELEGTIGVTGPASDFQAAILFYPPTDLLQMDPWNPARGGNLLIHDTESSPEGRMLGFKPSDSPEKTQQANPIRYVDEKDPPVMIIHGGSDTTVPSNQGESLYMALKNKSRDAVFIFEPYAPHGRNEAMVEDPQMQAGAYMLTSNSAGTATPPKSITPTWQTLIDFFDTHLKKKPQN